MGHLIAKREPTEGKATSPEAVGPDVVIKPRRIPDRPESISNDPFIPTPFLSLFSTSFSLSSAASSELASSSKRGVGPGCHDTAEGELIVSLFPTN